MCDQLFTSVPRKRLHVSRPRAITHTEENKLEPTS